MIVINIIYDGDAIMFLARIHHLIYISTLVLYTISFFSENSSWSKLLCWSWAAFIGMIILFVCSILLVVLQIAIQTWDCNGIEDEEKKRQCFENAAKEQEFLSHLYYFDSVLYLVYLAVFICLLCSHSKQYVQSYSMMSAKGRFHYVNQWYDSTKL